MTGCSKLWLVRHARPVIEPGICYGQTDVLADETATQQAAQRLAAVLPVVTTFKVSGLQRTQQLAQALLALRPDLPLPLVDARVNEINFGHFEMQAWANIPQSEFDAWCTAFADYRFGGQENVRALLQRVQEALSVLRQDGAAVHHVWITHAGVIRAVQWLLQQPRRQPEVSEWPQDAADCGVWMVLDLGLPDD
jgi:alpha-ribazole phosphatase